MGSPWNVDSHFDERLLFGKPLVLHREHTTKAIRYEGKGYISRLLESLFDFGGKSTSEIVLQEKELALARNYFSYPGTFGPLTQSRLRTPVGNRGSEAPQAKTSEP